LLGGLVAVAFVVVATRFRPPVYVYSLLLMGNLIFNDASYLDPGEPLVVSLGIASLTLISLSHRLLCKGRGPISRDTVRSALTAELESSRQESPSKPWARTAELAAFLLLPMAWYAATVLIDWASEFDRMMAREKFGLLPPTFLAIRLYLMLAVVALVCGAIFSHLRAALSSGQQASMTLRQELWNWNGREQRLVAKAVRKASRWNNSGVVPPR
jgi:hypothetical protein